MYDKTFFKFLIFGFHCQQQRLFKYFISGSAFRGNQIIGNQNQVIRFDLNMAEKIQSGVFFPYFF